MYDFVGGETLQLVQDIGVEKDTFTCFNKVRIYFHIYLTLQVPNTTIAEFANTVEDGTQLTLCLPVLSADNLGKQFGPRSGPTNRRA